MTDWSKLAQNPIPGLEPGDEYESLSLYVYVSGHEQPIEIPDVANHTQWMQETRDRGWFTTSDNLFMIPWDAIVQVQIAKVKLKKR